MKMAIDYNKQYNEVDRQLMQRIYERRGDLDLVDLMLLRNVNDQLILKNHFDSKFRKLDSDKNND